MPTFQVLILVLTAPFIRADCSIRELVIPNEKMDDVLLLFNCMTPNFNAPLVTLDMNNTFYIDTVKLDNRLDGGIFNVDIGTDCCHPPEFQSDCYRSCQLQNTVLNALLVQKFDCSDTVSHGRYLRVQWNQNRFCSGTLRVSDVHIFGCPSWERGSINLALKKPAKQSSSHPFGNAQLAVDGDSNGYFFHNSCSHTENNTESWLEINLQIAVPISNLVIYNRVDCCSERLNNVDILLGRSQGPCHDVTYETCLSLPGVLGRQTVVNCTRRSCSQYVRIKLNDEGVLTLCEVEVYGDYSIHDVPLSSSLQMTNVIQSEQMTICDTSPSQGDKSTSQTGDTSPSQTTGNTSPSQATGDTSPIQTTGNTSPSQTTGDTSPIQTTGDTSPSQTTGDTSPIQTTGNTSPSQTAGDTSPIQTTGNTSPSQTTGDTSPSQTTSDTSPSQTTGDTSPIQTTGDPSPGQTASDPSQGQTTYFKDKFATMTTGTTEQFSQMSATFNRKYMCRCARLDTTSIFNRSQMQEIQNEIKNALFTSRDTQSQQTRKKNCAQDNRKSAVGGGMLAIAILCIIPLVVIALDCMSLVARARELLCPKRINSFSL